MAGSLGVDRRTARSLLAAAWLGVGVGVGATVPGDSAVESFEGEIPGYVSASRPEGLSVSAWHRKDGSSSLRWEWRDGEALIFRHDIGDPKRVGGYGNYSSASFGVWLYRETPLPGALVFEFRQGERVEGSFRFPLGFTGWRQARVLYQHGCEGGKPTEKVDNVRIAAADGTPPGCVFLDAIGYNVLIDRRTQVLPEQAAAWQPPQPDAERFPKPERLTDGESAGVRALLGGEPGPGLDEGRVQDLCGRVTALGIVRDEHGIRGPVLDSPADITALACQVARAHQASRDAGQRRRLADGFLAIEEFLYDQGMQPGSGFSWGGYGGRAWADGVFLMREVLATAGRLARQLDYFLYNYGAAALFSEADPPSNMDYFGIDIRYQLYSCLLQADPAEQVRWLCAYKTMLERSILQPTSALKVDGSTFHHGGHYMAYATYQMPGLCAIVQRLSQTPWRLKPDAHERIRRAVLAQRFFCNRLEVPLSLSGRHPFACGGVSVGALDLLARSGTPDGQAELDPVAAAAYLRLVPAAAGQDPYRSAGIRPEPEPNGCLVMNYAGLLCQRRTNWLAAVHAQSRYVWGTEMYASQNRFGLFNGLGQLEILAGGEPVTAKASGREEPGWDWRHFEGTTAPVLPLARIANGNYTSMPTSPEPFVGGLSHQDRDGIFAMVMNQTVPGNRNIQARKSWFFFDDRIVCLGSGIACDEAEFPTQTTLCQKHLSRLAAATAGTRAEAQGQPEGPGRPPPTVAPGGSADADAFAATCLDDEFWSAFPEERQVPADTAHWFLDVQATGYYVPPGQALVLARRRQESRDHTDSTDTTGEFLTAWLDHGIAPTAAAYEYALLIRTTPAAMRGFAAMPTYRVLRRDPTAHLVWDERSRSWGCALFAAQALGTVHDGFLPTAVDRPCLILQTVADHGLVAMTVADPDLHLERGVSQPQTLRVTLRGGWHLDRAHQGVTCMPTAADETVMEIVCQHGASYGLRLVPGP